LWGFHVVALQPDGASRVQPGSGARQAIWPRLFPRPTNRDHRSGTEEGLSEHSKVLSQGRRRGGDGPDAASRAPAKRDRVDRVKSSVVPSSQPPTHHPGSCDVLPRLQGLDFRSRHRASARLDRATGNCAVRHWRTGGPSRTVETRGRGSMTTIVFYVLVGLAATKAYRDLVRPPREWMGELVTMFVSIVVGGVGAGALHVAGL
jgi:hypothetical protein